MNNEFMIPLKKQELLKGKDQYVVSEIIQFSECLKKHSTLKKNFKNSGCEAILDSFDYLFSFLYDPKEPSFLQMQDVYDDIIYVALEKIVSYSENSLSGDSVEKKRAVNVIKMTFYVFSMYLRTYEEKISFNKDNFISDVKRGRMKVKSKVGKPEDSWPWNDRKREAIAVIYSFLQLPILNLWQTSEIEEPFINMLGNCCYKTLECQAINQVKLNPLRDSIAQVLATLILQFNHSLSFVPKSVHLMKQHEHAASALSSIVLVIVCEYGCKTLLPLMLKELLDVVQDDPQNLGKSAGTFISDLAENDATIFLTSLKQLVQFLNFDAYQVRIAVLVAFTEMITKCFSKDDISGQAIKKRDGILSIILKFIHDENAYVRSKVLQLLVKLATSFCIPIDMYVDIMKNVIYRLTDKSVFVSKNAINFFNVILVHNPYAGKFLLYELKTNLDKEKNELKQVALLKPLSPEDLLNQLETNIVISVTEYIEKDRGAELTNGHADPGVPISDVMFIISKLIKQELFDQAIALLIQAEELYPDAPEIRCNIDKKDKIEYYVCAMKKIFLTTAETSPLRIIPEYHNNVQKMESLRKQIKYYEGCINFVETINEASSIIYKLMFSSNTSEVLEAIEFFSAAYKFKIENSSNAVRDMLLLVRSTKPELKEAVAKAYKSLYLETNKTSSRAKAIHIAGRLIKLVTEIDHEQRSALEVLLQQWISTNELEKEFIMVLLNKLHMENDVVIPENELVAVLVILDMIASFNGSLVSGNFNLLKSLLGRKMNPLVTVYICNILAHINSSKDKKMNRYNRNSELFQIILDVLVESFDDFKYSEYSNVASAILRLIFEMCTEPEEVANDLLFRLYKKMREAAPGDKRSQTHAGLLGRLIFVCADIVFRKYHYYEKDVFNALKRCKDGIAPSKKTDEIDDLDMDFEADNIVAADDELYEQIIKTCDKHLLKDDSFVGFIRNIVQKICKGMEESTPSELKVVAALALSKFMMVSHSFCEEMFPLYVTMMDKSNNEILRSNLVLAFGDLMVHFPNVSEPWTSYLYARLSDHSVLVRKNTVSVLCQLISREMIKVRGQIAELVLHIDDMEPLISKKVKNLLHDISQKGNTLYNVIPDIISNLSNPARTESVSPSTFKTVIGHIFGLITKERQNHLLVEKLCLRLKESTVNRQSEDLVFCLSQLTYSDKCLHKLVDALPTLVDKLSHPPVHDTIKSIIGTCSKSNKSSLKEIAGEASSLLEKLMTIEGEDVTLDRTHESKKSNENKQNGSDLSCDEEPVKKKKTSKFSAKKNPKVPPTPVRSSNRRRNLRKQYLSDSEDEDE